MALIYPEPLEPPWPVAGDLYLDGVVRIVSEQAMDWTTGETQFHICQGQEIYLFLHEEYPVVGSIN